MAVVIGHTTAFGEVETKKQAELRYIRYVVFEVIRDWCAHRGRPLNASIHAPVQLRKREQISHEAALRKLAAPCDADEKPISDSLTSKVRLSHLLAYSRTKPHILLRCPLS